MNEPRNVTDPKSFTPGGPAWKRVVIIDTAEPLKKFDVRLTVPKEPPPGWDPEDSESEDADLWRETDTIIKGVRYGLPSDETFDAGSIGWILDDYYGRPVLLLAECV